MPNPWTRAAVGASLIALATYAWAGRGHTVMMRAVGAAAEDFDYSYAADAQRLRRGEPFKDEYRGPLYPLVLTAVTGAIPGLSMLRAGVWISTVAASGALLFAFFAVRPLVGPQPAFLAVLGTAVTATFFRHATHEGIDMFFAFLSLASTAAMVEAGPGRRGWALAAGLFAGLALDTRWNAVFLPLGAAFYFATAAVPRLLWPYGAGLAALWTPWLIANARLHGNPFHNHNHLNVAYGMYGRLDGSDWQAFFDRVIAGRDPYGSLTTVVLGDPVLFLGRWVLRLGEHLVGIGTSVGPSAWLAFAGLTILLASPDRRRHAAFLAPVASLVLTNATYMYLDRRNLAVIPYVLACAAYFLWRFMADRVLWRRAILAASWVVLILFAGRRTVREAVAARAAEGRYVAWAEPFLAARPARPFVGDWDGDGKDGVGTFVRGSFALRETPSAGAPDRVLRIASLSIDIPVAARAAVAPSHRPGVHRQGLWLFEGMAFGYGHGLDQPLMGDWNGDGRDEPATYDGITFHLASVAPPRAPRADLAFDLASSSGAALEGGIAVAGDWDGNGTDTMGLFQDGRWTLNNANDFSPPEHEFPFGAPGDVPLAGDWDGDGMDTVGVFRAGEWILTNRHGPGAGELRFRFP